MASVVADMSMSLDGFVADASDGVEQVFAWYSNGDVEVPTANPEMTFRTSEGNARRVRQAFESVGAIVYGRRTFDLAGGWRPAHPAGVPVVVLTHSVPEGWPRDDSPCTFVTEGVEAAVSQARELAGGKVVAIGSPGVAQQCLDAGLLDMLQVAVVPVLLGKGIRFFGDVAGAPLELGEPRVIQGDGVTHLHYSVRA